MTAADAPAPPADERLILDLDGFEGPIDLLLTLAREQKVDLARISILALAEQYLAFIQNAQGLRLEIAAEYLVMAAWLAYLKSRLLLPEGPEDPDDGPSGEELAEALAQRLRRLAAIRRAAAELPARALGGRGRLARGRPEGIRVHTSSAFRVHLHELLRAYVEFDRRVRERTLVVRPPPVFRVEDALRRLAERLGGPPEWRELRSFLPAGLADGLLRRSAVAASFAASLELVRTGRAELRQMRPFGPIFIRRTTTGGGGGTGP
jgi:segregation and condensation protein A